MKTYISGAALAAISLLALSGTAFAQSNESAGDFQVTLTVENSCTASVDDLDFGSIGDFDANVDAAADITVTCTGETPFQIGLDNGENHTGTTRAMLITGGGTETVEYGLFSDEARTTAWGNTLGDDTHGGTGTAGAQTVILYGRVPSGQTAVVGSFSDTVVATLWYGTGIPDDD